MKKITNFIVEKRNIILFLFLILTGVCFYTMNKVTINYELSSYLPKTSETRKGMDLMEEEFTTDETSSLNVMFEDLSSEEKTTILEELKAIDGVASVSYDETEEYNKENYTLYKLNVNDASDSKIAKTIFDAIKQNYKEYTYYTSGSISLRNSPVMPMWIMVVAIFFAMLILILMCESYVEPFLFLFAIGLAVFLNKGTNIWFSSVSNITDSIVAILQMALSMDYSIMLMNRYTQEKEKEKDKVAAMKKALYHSFSSISSSSITTIVGLLALVFMSFTIGKDLGLVLAKGVLFSLISIFFCLPGLILIFDKWIMKTKKKVLSIKLDWLGKSSYKTRYLAPILLLLLFGGSYLLQGNLDIAYSSSEEDKISTVFKEENPMVVLYKNEEEEKASQYCQELEKDENIKNVLCYGNTIHEDLTYKELKTKLDDLDNSNSLDVSLLKILYFYKFNDDEIQMTPTEFVQFLDKNVLSNSTFSKKIDASLSENIELLKKVTEKEEMNKKRTSKELATFFGMDENVIKNLLVYYNANHVNAKMTISTFIQFLNKDILTNPTYASMLDRETKEQILKLQTFTNIELIQKEMHSSELASLFDLDESLVEQLLLFDATHKESSKTLSISDFIDCILYLKENTHYLDPVDATRLEALARFSRNENQINTTKVDKATLSLLFDSSLVNSVYSLLHLPDDTLFTPQEFVNLVLNSFGEYLEEEQKQSLSLLKLVIEDSLASIKTQYKASEMATLFGMEKESGYQIYALQDYIHHTMDSYTMTPQYFVSLLIRANDQVLLDEQTLTSLRMLEMVMDNTLKNTSYTSKEMADLFQMKEKDMNLLYSYYEINSLKKSSKLSYKAMVDFLLSDVLQNKSYASLVKEEEVVKLRTVQEIMDSSLEKKKYSASAMIKNLEKLSGNLDSNMIELLYIYYGSEMHYQESWKMTLFDFITYLKQTILEDEHFSSFITNDMKEMIHSSYDTMDLVKKNLVGTNYSRMIINTLYPLESEETERFVANMKEWNLNDFYIIGDSPMAYEMSETFPSELNFITILTMLFIFVVVAFTFKSILIPLVLVLIIQCAVYVTMGILSLMGGSVYFIALLIVQSILMGATIDYAILYTSYYLESRKTMTVKEAIINSYNKSIHTIFTSSSILIIVTFIVGLFATEIAAKICKTLSQGTLCSVLLILLILPAVLAAIDKFIVKKDCKK